MKNDTGTCRVSERQTESSFCTKALGLAGTQLVGEVPEQQPSGGCCAEHKPDTRYVLQDGFLKDPQDNSHTVSQALLQAMGLQP